MTDIVLIALIAATPPTLAGLAALISSMRHRKDLHYLEVRINGRMDQLLDAARQAGHAEGVADEKASQK